MASQTRLSTLLSRDAAGMEEAHLLLLRVSLYNLLGGQRNNFLETQREDVGTVMHQHIKIPHCLRVTYSGASGEVVSETR